MAKANTNCPRCHQRSARIGIVSWKEGGKDRVAPKYECRNVCRNSEGKAFEFVIKEGGAKVDVLDLAPNRAVA